MSVRFDMHDGKLLLGAQLQDGCHVVVRITVVRRGEERDEHGDLRARRLAEEPHAVLLYFVSADDREQIIAQEEISAGVVREEVRAAANVVRFEVRLLIVDVIEIFTRIGPEQIAQGTRVRRLLESIETFDVGQRANLRRDTAVHAQETRVNQCADRQGVEGLHARVVQRSRVVLLLAFESELERFGHLPSLVISAVEAQMMYGTVGDLDGEPTRGVDGCSSDI